VFPLTIPTKGQELELPPELLITVAVFSLPKGDFDTMVKKEKLPKPRLTELIARHLLDILSKREEAYETTIEVRLCDAFFIFSLSIWPLTLEVEGR
jgi:hypothetical protein